MISREERVALVERLRGYVEEGDMRGTRAKNPTTIAVRNDIEKAIAALEPNERLIEAALECADDLEAELRHRWCHEPDGSCHPALQAKFDRDMAVVLRVRNLSTTKADQ